MATPFKVYSPDGEFLASTRYAEDAAVLVAVGTGGTVRYEHRQVLWTENAEEFSAGESYDQAALVMHQRLAERAAQVKAKNDRERVLS